MGNITLGTAVQPFLLQGPKFEFSNTEYASGSVEQNNESASNCVKNESEINAESESTDNSPSTFQNNINVNTVSFNSETSSSNTFSQSNSYDFQSYS